MKRTITAVALVVALAGCTQTDEAREYAEAACTNYADGSVGLSVDYAPVATFTALRTLLDDEVTPGLASAAKRDDKYDSAHTAASDFSASLALVISTLKEEATPNKQSISDRAVEDFRRFTAECDVILAD